MRIAGKKTIIIPPFVFIEDNFTEVHLVTNVRNGHFDIKDMTLIGHYFIDKTPFSYRFVVYEDKFPEYYLISEFELECKLDIQLPKRSIYEHFANELYGVVPKGVLTPMGFQYITSKEFRENLVKKYFHSTGKTDFWTVD